MLVWLSLITATLFALVPLSLVYFSAVYFVIRSTCWTVHNRLLLFLPHIIYILGKVVKEPLNMTPFKWFKNAFFLSLNTIISMIVSPNIFRQIQSQSFLAETAFCRQSSWKVSPESFPTIDMVSFAMAVLTWVRFYQAMNIAISYNSGLAFPALITK